MLTGPIALDPDNTQGTPTWNSLLHIYICFGQVCANEEVRWYCINRLIEIARG